MASLYRSVLASQLDLLPEPMRSFHDSTFDRQVTGAFMVKRATGIRGLVAWMLGFPPSGVDVPLRVEVCVVGNRERWVRYFRSKRLITSQWKHGEVLIEASGPVRLGFQLRADENGLTCQLRRWWFWFIPMPLQMGTGIHAITAARQLGWFVDVTIALPIIGQIIRYAGEVDVDSMPVELVEQDGQ